MNTVQLHDMDASPLERVFDGAEPQTNFLQLAAGEHVPEHQSRRRERCACRRLTGGTAVDD
jgi:hypothetical protein